MTDIQQLSGFKKLRARRSLSATLGRIALLALAFAVAFMGVSKIQHSSWNKQRLYRKFIQGSRDQQLEAALYLIQLEAEPELPRALHSISPTTRHIALNSLYFLWSQAAGRKAYAQIEAAEQAIARGEWEESLIFLNQLVRDYPGFADAWNRRAVLRSQHRDYVQATADAEEALQRNPVHLGAWQTLGWARLRLGQIDAACHAFFQALRLSPRDPELQWILEHSQALRRELKSEPTVSLDLVWNSPGSTLRPALHPHCLSTCLL